MKSNKTYKPRKQIIEGIMKDRKLKPMQGVKNILNQHHVRT